MEVKSTVAMSDIKSRMDSLFIFASQVEYKGKHPLRVIHASKSLIGINLESPLEVLLKWLEKYLKDFTLGFNITQPDSDKVAQDTITYTHFKTLIIEKKKGEAYTYLGNLLQVANPCHIAEYLVELAVKISPKSLLFCWAAFRSIQFVAEKDVSIILYHCVTILLEKDEGETNSKDSLMGKYEVYCHQFQIRSSDMVRKSKIIPQLDQLVKIIEPELILSAFPKLPETLKKMIIIEGVIGIHTYLYQLKLDDISEELLLRLDALRSVLKFSGLSYVKVLKGIF